jgi:DNA-binding XRE family transcriptional regulator
MPRRPQADEQPAPQNGRPRGVKDKDPELVLLGRKVLALRHESELTQEELAQAADLHWTYVGQIERGERNPTYRNLLKLARGLEIDLPTLLQAEPE